MAVKTDLDGAVEAARAEIAVVRGEMIIFKAPVEARSAQFEFSHRLNTFQEEAEVQSSVFRRGTTSEGSTSVLINSCPLGQ